MEMSYGNRQRSGTGDSLQGGGVASTGVSVGLTTTSAATMNRTGDAVLESILAGEPGKKLPLVPGLDETFVSRDTGVTGEGGRGERVKEEEGKQL